MSRTLAAGCPHTVRQCTSHRCGTGERLERRIGASPLLSLCVY